MQLRHGSLLHFLSEDFMDAYRAMRSSIGLHESDEVSKINNVDKQDYVFWWFSSTAVPSIAHKTDELGD